MKCVTIGCQESRILTRDYGGPKETKRRNDHRAQSGKRACADDIDECVGLRRSGRPLAWRLKYSKPCLDWSRTARAVRRQRATTIARLKDVGLGAAALSDVTRSAVARLKNFLSPSQFVGPLQWLARVKSHLSMSLWASFLNLARANVRGQRSL
jgi:hypothetical protein